MVAGGTYYPSRQNPGAVPGTVLNANALKSFVIPSGVQVYGGFAGTETNLNQRTQASRAANVTVLHGNNQSHHVVFILNPAQPVRLDGFVIAGGQTNSYRSFQINYYLSLYGGGVLIQDAGNRVTLANCSIQDNIGETGGGLYSLSSSPTITNCVFANNEAYRHGGAVFNDDSSPTFTNCVFGAIGVVSSQNQVWAVRCITLEGQTRHSITRQSIAIRVLRRLFTMMVLQQRFITPLFGAIQVVILAVLTAVQLSCLTQLSKAEQRD
ncbi:MAG: hypothetical protein HC817_01570 [Saprospiraceae bacterium]|nr:hypothetical protein [Saprospiraceae bacterium]